MSLKSQVLSHKPEVVGRKSEAWDLRPGTCDPTERSEVV